MNKKKYIMISTISILIIIFITFLFFNTTSKKVERILKKNGFKIENNRYL